MGALQKIRSKSTLLVGIIAVGLLAFIIPWGEITQFLNVSKDRAFVVNGDVIKTGQYSQRVEERENIEKERMMGQPLNEFQLAQIREEVFQTMVTEKLLDDQTEKLGLAITKAELNDMTYGFDISPVLREFFSDENGQFNREALNQLLTEVNKDYSSDPGMQMQQAQWLQIWTYIENRMKYTRLEEKYASLVAGSVLVNDIEAKAYFDESNAVSDMIFVTKSYSAIADSTIQVLDKEIQDLYNIKKENFFSKYPSRYLTYFVKNVTPSEADYEEVAKQMEDVKIELADSDNPGLIVNQYSSSQYLDAFIATNTITSPEIKNFVQTASVGDIYGPFREDRSYAMYKYVDKTIAPDSVELSLIPVQVFDPAQATAIADSLQTVLKGGKSFKALAQEMYPGMQGVGESRWYREAEMTPDIAAKCFNASKGSVLTVTLNGTTSLIKIDDLTKPVSKVKIAEVTMPVIVSDKTNNGIDNEINKFIAENKDPKGFAQAALNSGYYVLNDVPVYPNNPGIDNISGTREVIRWAFNTEDFNTIKKFDTSDARIVAMVTGATDEGYIPVSDKNVSDILKAEIRKNKKAEKLIEELKSKNASSLPSLAEALDTKVDSVNFVTFQTNSIAKVGYEPIFNAYAKQGAVSKMTEPLQGNSGVYVLNITDKKEEGAEFDKDLMKRMLQSSNGQMLANSASYLLFFKMDVEDNRIKFY